MHDPDDAPPLDKKFFEKAELRIGNTIIRNADGSMPENDFGVTADDYSAIHDRAWTKFMAYNRAHHPHNRMHPTSAFQFWLVAETKAFYEKS